MCCLTRRCVRHPVCTAKRWCVFDWRGPGSWRLPPGWCCRTGLAPWPRSAGKPSAAPAAQWGTLRGSLNKASRDFRQLGSRVVSAEGSARQFNCHSVAYCHVYYSETWCNPTAQQNNQTEKLTYGASLLAAAVHGTARERTRPVEEQQAAQVFQELRQPVLLQVTGRFGLSLRRHRLCLFVGTRCYDTAAEARARFLQGCARFWHPDHLNTFNCETTWRHACIPNFPEGTCPKG